MFDEFVMLAGPHAVLEKRTEVVWEGDSLVIKEIQPSQETGPLTEN